MNFDFLFSLAFLVAFAKYYWDLHKTSFLISAVTSYLTAPSQSGDGMSKTERQLSGIHHLSFKHRGKSHKIILPRKQKDRTSWVRAIAMFEDKGPIDVTVLVEEYAGPNRDFYGMTYRAKDLVRHAQAITFEGDDGLLFSFV
jgi:hypothetical protein